MKTIKRLVAIALALLMILGSVSVASAAWNVETSEGKTLSITTEIFRKVNDEWTKTDKVKQGEEVKARIYLNTDYYTNTGNLLFFYNNDFFEDSFGAAKQTLTVNPFYAEKPYGISGTFVGQDGTPAEDYLLGYEKIDEEFADSHNLVYISYLFEGGVVNQKLSESQWIFEIPLKVKADAASGTGVGDFFAVEESTRSTSFRKGYINVPKGPYDGTQKTITSMSNWDAILDYESNPVTLYTNLVSVSFDAGTYGEFDDGSSVYRTEGDEGDKLEVPEPTRANYKFVGWIVKGEDESTAASVTKFPSAATEYEAVWESTTASTDTLDFVTKFYRLDPETNEWIYTEKVKRGETVKARLFVDTSFYTNAGNIIVFYDKDFFDDEYEYNDKLDLVVNTDPQSTAALYNMAGEFTNVPTDGNAIKNLVNKGYITSDFAASHEAITLRFEFEENKNKKLDGNYWLAEFTFTVSDEAEGEGEMLVDTKTIKNSGAGVYAYINLPRGEKDGAKETNESMYFWDVNATSKSYPVTLDSSITLLANGGTFDAENEDKFVFEGYIGDAVDYSTVPALSRTNYTFKGWVDASIENPTEADVVDLSAVASEIPYEAASYKALWINDVEITFVLNKEENIKVNKMVSAGAPFEAVEDPVREGHRFLGWTTDEKLGKITGLPANYPTTNTTYYAVFDEITYKVNYYVLNENTKKFDLVTEGFYSYGDVISSVPASYEVPEGYTLSKAYTDVTLTTEFVEGTTMGIEEVNLYYSLELGTFDAVFMVDGTEYARIPTVYDELVEAPEDPVKEGHTFTGWEPYVGTMDEEGKIYTAVFEITEYTVTWNVLGEDVDVFTVPYGSDVEYTAEPDVDGYDFLGWSEDPDADAAGTVLDKMPARDLTYYAVLDAKEYTISFTDTGDSTIDPITQDFGTEIVAPEDPVKEGYVFKGWADAEGNIVEVPATMPSNNVVLEATWEKDKFTVTWVYDDDGITADYVVELEYEAAIVPPADPTTKVGHTFKEWSPAVQATMPAMDLTYTAIWTVDSHNAIFNADGGKFADGEATNTVPTNYGAQIVAPADPTKTGYVFAGWDNLPGIMGTEDQSFTAKWDAAKDTPYTVKYFTMDTKGDYDLDNPVVVNRTGTTDTEVEAAVTLTEGFYLDNKSTVKATIAPDGSTVLEVYYARELYTVTFDANGGVLAGAAASAEYYHGATVEVPTATLEGYEFKGWDKNVSTIAVANADYVAQWTAKQYTITFDTLGGTAIDSITADYKATVNAPAAVTTKTGYTFIGWSETAGDTTEVTFPVTMPLGGDTYYAIWDANEYTITFDTVGGTTIGPITQDFDTPITAPADPTKEGHEFDKWDVAVPEKMPAENMTITAQWIVNKYDVTFNVDGVKETENVEFGSEIVVPDAPAKDGYTFTGWADKDGKTPADYVTVPSTDVEFVAQWDANEYTITFDTLGGTPAIDDIKADYEQPITAPATEPAKQGYTFGGWVDENGNPATVPSTMPLNGMKLTAKWNPDADTPFKVVVNYTDAITGEAVAEEYPDYTGTTDNAIAIVESVPDPAAANTEYVLLGDFAIDNYELDETAENQLTGVVAADGSTVLNLYYVPVKYTATFDAAGGAWKNTDTSRDVVVSYGQLVKPLAPTEEPVREGFKFEGWNGLNDATTLDGDRTFTAKWTENTYTITYIVDDASSSETYKYNAIINKPVNPSKDGYKFEGWTPAIPNNMPAKDVTVEATWSILSYNVTWNVDGKETTDTFVYDSKIYAPQDPTKEGYTFTGWKDAEGNALPADMPAEDITVYAQWAVNPYTVNYFVYEPATGKFAAAGSDSVEYNKAIPTDVPASYTVPAGYSLVAQAYTDIALATPLAAGTLMPAETVNLYYTLKANTYNAVFTVDGKEHATVPTEYGKEIVAPSDPAKEGYTFTGWNPEVGTMDDVNGKTFVAQFEEKTYNAVFKANGGLFTINNESETTVTVPTKFGAPVVAPAAPAKEGNEFLGWATTATATEAGTLAAAMPANDVTYYAVYKVKQYKITFNTDGGTAVEPITKDFGAAITAPTAPTKNGFTFSGWDALPTTMPAKDTTVNAIWTRNNYTVTWKVDGNTVKSETLAFEAAVVAPDDPVKEGYKFDGWSPAPVTTMPAQNLEYIATWVVKEYTATFDANGGKYADNSTSKTQKFDFGAPVTAPEVPTQTGFTFAGWEPALGTMPAADTTYKAVWSAGEEKTYTINVYTMDTKGNYGDPVPETKTAKVGEKVKVTATPLEGFYLDTNKVNVLEDVIKADQATVLEVYYARNAYTIAFDGNSGTVDGEASVSDTYYHGATVVAPVAVKEGYSFTGWDTELSTVAVKDASYKAQWNINEYTVSFDTDGGIPMLPITQDFGTDIADPGTPVKEGYKFTGWVDANGDPAEVPEKMPAENTALKATWEKDQFTVTFYTEKEMKEEQVHQRTQNDFGAEFIAPGQPFKTGYTFQGWVNDATGKVETFATPVATPACDVNYYASWEINSNKVVYRTYNGLYKEYIVEFGTPKAEIPVPELDPTQPGYTFTGWSPALPETMPDRQLTILAEWEANEYKANFYKNIGDTEVYEDADVIYGEAIIAPDEDPTMPGYVFEGWSTDGENVIDDLGTIGDSDANFYAVWTEATNVEYKVEHYYMDVNKNYPEEATRVDKFNNGTTNETVTATPDNDKNFSVDNGKSVLSGVVAADGSLVLKVYYIREINTLTITVDGVETEKEYPFEAPVDPVADPEKEGHKFAGWVDENDNPVQVPATMPEDDVTIKATWTVESYDVTYISDSKTYYGPTATEYGKPVYVPAEPVKEGYEFLGWYTADGKTPADFAAMPASALEFTAKWEANSNISYILEVYEMDTEGEYPSAATETIKYDDGVVDTEKTAAYTAPTGFTLDTAKSVLTGTVPATGTLVLKAYLIRDKYTLTVVVDNVTTDEIEYFYNETVDAVDEPTKVGYVFTGWDPKVPVVMPAEDVTVNATWKEDVFTATFDAGEGKFESTGETTEDIGVAFDSPITAPTEKPVREGYEFGGWATPDAPETPVTDYGKMDADGADFIAIWKKTDFTVTFYDYRAPSDGVVAPTEKYEYASSTKQFGDTVTIPGDPSFVYYRFLGWSKIEGDKTNLITSADTVTMPSEDLTFYAVYEKVPVYLIPKNDTCTTVIDREGGEYTDYDPTISEWYVYGLEEYITETTLLDSFIDVTGDGRIEIVYEKNGLGGTWAPYTGTGTIINVYDRLGTEETTDDILVESFRIIIFGDLDGDASVQAIDERYAREEVAGKTHWSNPFAPAEEYKPYLLKAGDISGDGTIEGDDATYIGDHTLQSIVVIDQVTGRIQ